MTRSALDCRFDLEAVAMRYRETCALSEDWRWYEPEDYLNHECRRPPHPAVLRAMGSEAFQALGYAETCEALFSLALEWPYIPESTDDKAKVAYTRDPAAGKANRQVVGKLGGYLVRHFPMLGGHVIEKIVGAWRGEVAGDNFKVLRTMSEILHAIETTTAKSCMCGSAKNFSGGIHPYSVYDPALGWGLAVHENINGDFVSRAVVHMGDEHISKRFVRIYSSRADGGYNCDNAAFRDWLENQGFASKSGFLGGRLKVIPYRGEYIAPYLDGCQGCYLGYQGNDEVFIIGGDEFEFNQTSGLSEESHSGQVQTDSGGWIDEEDAIYIEDSYYHVDECVTECEGGRWILRDNAVRVSGDWYSSESENIVSLDDGDLCHVEDACCLSDGSWVLAEDAVCVESCEEWELRENCVETPDGWELREDCVETPDGWELREDCVETPDGYWFRRLDCRLLQSGAWCHEEDAVRLPCGDWIHVDDVPENDEVENLEVAS